MLYELSLSSAPLSPFIRARSGYASFPDDLREFISLRLDRVNPYRESKEYCLQQEKASRLYEMLRETLPEEGQAMLRQYSEAMGAAHYLEVAILSERAFFDGIRVILRATMNDK